MKSALPDSGLLIRYLLGELPEEECLRLEQDCLENDQLFEQLEAVEAELTDDYVRGFLDGRRRKEFEKRILTAPGGAENIDLARLITGRSDRRRSLLAGLKAWIAGLSLHARLLQVSAAAATLALVITLGLFSLRQRVTKPESPQPLVAQSRPPSASQTATVQPKAASIREQRSHPLVAIPRLPEHAPPQPPLIATFTLMSGSVRGEGDTNEITIPRGAKRVQFRIDLLSKEYKRYRASLNRVEGEQLFISSASQSPAGRGSARNDVKIRPSKTGETLVIELPARVLPFGTSVLTLTGVGANGATQEVGKYVILLH